MPTQVETETKSTTQKENFFSKQNKLNRFAIGLTIAAVIVCLLVFLFSAPATSSIVSGFAVSVSTGLSAIGLTVLYIALMSLVLSVAAIMFFYSVAAVATCKVTRKGASLAAIIVVFSLMIFILNSMNGLTDRFAADIMYMTGIMSQRWDEALTEHAADITTFAYSLYAIIYIIVAAVIIYNVSVCKRIKETESKDDETRSEAKWILKDSVALCYIEMLKHLGEKDKTWKKDLDIIPLCAYQELKNKYNGWLVCYDRTLTNSNDKKNDTQTEKKNWFDGLNASQVHNFDNDEYKATKYQKRHLMALVASDKADYSTIDLDTITAREADLILKGIVSSIDNEDTIKNDENEDATAATKQQENKKEDNPATEETTQDNESQTNEKTIDDETSNDTDTENSTESTSEQIETSVETETKTETAEEQTTENTDASTENDEEATKEENEK